MQLDLIITALRARCPGLTGGVAGAAQFKLLQESAALAVPCAFVIPLDDNPERNRSQNSIRQPLVESFAVIVAIDNTPDEKGHAAVHSVDSLRTELWAGLLGWSPLAEGETRSRYRPIEYQGGSLLALDRGRLWWQFEFGAEMELSPEDGWQETALAAGPHFDGATVNVDVIDPIANPAPGPDGRIEFVVTLPKTGSLP